MYTNLKRIKQAAFFSSLTVASFTSFANIDPTPSSWFMGVRVGAVYMTSSLSPKIEMGAPADVYTNSLNMHKGGIGGEVFVGCKKPIHAFHWITELGISMDGAHKKRSNFQLFDDAQTFGDRVVFGMKRHYSGFLSLGAGKAISDTIDLNLKVKILFSQFKTHFVNLADTDLNGRRNTYEWGIAPGLQLSYKVSDHCSLDLNYSYEVYNKLQSQVLYHNDNQDLTYSAKGKPRYHAIMIGATYHF